AKQSQAAWLDLFACLQGPAAKTLEVGQASQRIESLLALMQAQQVVLAHRLRFQVPDRLRYETVVPGQRQRECSFGLDARQSGSCVENPFEIVPLRKIVGTIADQIAGDLLQLLAIGQLVFNDNEELFELDWNLHDRRQDDDEGALLLAGDELAEDGLNDFRAVQEAMEVVQQEDGGAIGLRQGGQSAKGQLIAGKQ